MDFKHVSCSICKKDHTKTILKQNKHALVQCQNCGFIYADPQPTLDYIKKNFTKGYLDYILAHTPGEIQSAIYRTQLIKNKIPAGRILDVGFGAGYFVKQLELSGYEAFGIELSGESCSFANQYLSLKNIYYGDLSQQNFPNDFFDVITLWDCMQYVHDPYGTIELAKKLLKPKGMLCVQVPNRPEVIIKYAQFLHKISKFAAGRLIYFPGHVNQFKSDNLERIFKELCLTYEKISGREYNYSSGGRNLKDSWLNFTRNIFVYLANKKKEKDPLTYLAYKQ